MPFDFAVPDWEDRLKKGESLLPDLPLDWDEAERAVGIFNRLRLPDVSGLPTLKDAAGEWQRDIVRALFGSLVDGERQVPEILCLVPKKNSKTTGGAAITITALLMNTRPRADFIYVGPTQEVADRAFQQTAGMIEADPFLLKRFHIQHHTKTIKDLTNGTKLKVVTFDMKVMTGAKPAFVLLDELHLMDTMNGADRVIAQIRGGRMANPEAMFVMITTQSDLPPAGAFKAELDYARKVRDGLITEDVFLLPLLYEFSEKVQRDGEWRNPAIWPQVHPNLGRPFTIETLTRAYRQAKDKGDVAERIWASQHLNVQIGLAMHHDRWLGADYWEARSRPKITLEHLLERSEVITVGIDGGGLDDLFGLCVMGREKETSDWLCWFHGWCFETVFEKRKQIADRLRDFEKDGDLTVCKEDEPNRDFREVCDIIAKINAAKLLPDGGAVGLDPFGVAELVSRLLEAGLTEDQLEGVAQGVRLTSSVWGMERRLKDKRLFHNGSPFMNWCVGNAKAEQRGNATYIAKQAAGKAKIDPLIAGFNAFHLMAQNPVNAFRSVYETSGIKRI
jgi:phage terminase large subunit-like protein